MLRAVVIAPLHRKAQHRHVLRKGRVAQRTEQLELR
jgi:hypothetical protein